MTVCINFVVFSLHRKKNHSLCKLHWSVWYTAKEQEITNCRQVQTQCSLSCISGGLVQALHLKCCCGLRWVCKWRSYGINYFQHKYTELQKSLECGEAWDCSPSIWRALNDRDGHLYSYMIYKGLFSYAILFNPHNSDEHTETENTCLVTLLISKVAELKLGPEYRNFKSHTFPVVLNCLWVIHSVGQNKNFDLFILKPWKQERRGQVRRNVSSCQGQKVMEILYRWGDKCKLFIRNACHWS